MPLQPIFLLQRILLQRQYILADINVRLSHGLLNGQEAEEKKIAARLRSPIGNLVEKNVLKNTSFQTNNIHLFSVESNKAR